MPIKLFPHDPDWELLYEEARQQLLAALGSYAMDIQHVGSTSIAGIAAKPVIDIAVAIRQYPLPDNVITAISDLGYTYRGEFGIPRRHFFSRRDLLVGYNVHINELSNDEFQRHVLFRDYLRAHVAVKREYEDLKRDLASRYRDVGQYADNKSDFVKGTLESARAWRAIQEAVSNSNIE